MLRTLYIAHNGYAARKKMAHSRMAHSRIAHNISHNI